MLGDQLEEFSGRDGFAHMLVGIVGLTERVAAVAAIPRSDGGVCADGPLAYLLLGVISAGLTLRAALLCDQTVAGSESKPEGAGSAGEPGTIEMSKGMMR
jgi:hypothetical protein